MSEKPRRWFQIHLSTAVVMMFVAGGLMWANLQKTRIEAPGLKEWYLGASPKFTWVEFYGWPEPAFTRFPIWAGSAVWRMTGVNETIIWLNVALDFATVATVLFVSMFLCEWRIRRREARKP